LESQYGFFTRHFPYGLKWVNDCIVDFVAKMCKLSQVFYIKI